MFCGPIGKGLASRGVLQVLDGLLQALGVSGVGQQCIDLRVASFFQGK